MRIKDIIIEKDLTKIVPKKIKGDIEKFSLLNPFLSSEPGPKGTIGSGATSIVLQKQHKPHEVVRITHYAANPKTDPYIRYINFAMKNSGNPFFPKIYNIRYFVNKKQKNYMYYIELEKLTPLRDLNWKQISSIINNIFGVTIRSFNFDRVTIGHKDSVFHLMELAFREYIADEKPSKLEIKDELLKKTLDSIKKVLKLSFVYLDISPKNMMARITPYGAQLVITDPVI